MKWILKLGQESFEVMEGTMAGRKFQPGKVYAEIPETEKNRFKKWGPTKAKPAKNKTTPKTGAKPTKGTENKK